jgi:hypothetical protein
LKNSEKIYYIHNGSNVTLFFLKKKHLSDQCVNKTFDTFNYFSTPTLVETLGKKQGEQA